jgi:hypothetical protein
MIQKNREEEILEQLGLLKGITVRLGILHEAQVLQLQMWPLVLFPHALSSTAEVDTDKHIVNFKILTSLKNKPSGKSHTKAVKELDKWVKNILWDDTRIKFEWIISDE